MRTTRITLLGRVKDLSNQTTWVEFHDLYAPLLYNYARSRGLTHADAEEIRDECLEVVARKITAFEYDRSKGGFKCWLYRIASCKVIDMLRKKREKRADTRAIRLLADAEPAPDDLWEQHWRNEHLKYCGQQARDSVSELSYRAFHILLFDGCAVPDVCEALGLKPNQVYKAKSRVLKRVREVLEQLGTGDGVAMPMAS